jgi:hypothetical protein
MLLWRLQHSFGLVLWFSQKSQSVLDIFFLVLPSVGPLWHSIFPSSDTWIKNSLIWMWLAAKQNKVFLCHRNENMKLHKFMFTKIKQNFSFLSVYQTYLKKVTIHSKNYQDNYFFHFLILLVVFIQIWKLKPRQGLWNRGSSILSKHMDMSKY